MSFTDTPDYQRGSVSAQQLLGSYAGTVQQATVTVPVNAETLVVACASGEAANSLQCVGVTTLLRYPGKLLGVDLLNGVAGVTFFDVSSAVDSQVTVEWYAPPGAKWYIYADATPRLVTDVANHTDYNGVQYGVPSAPSSVGGDHPPSEVLLISVTSATASQYLIGPPGAGQRIRLFRVACATRAAASSGWVGVLIGSTEYEFAYAAGPATPSVSNFTDFPLSGFACGTNEPVWCRVGGGTLNYEASYITEAV